MLVGTGAGLLAGSSLAVLASRRLGPAAMIAVAGPLGLLAAGVVIDRVGLVPTLLGVATVITVASANIVMALPLLRPAPTVEATGLPARMSARPGRGEQILDPPVRAVRSPRPSAAGTVHHLNLVSVTRPATSVRW
ncbi:hypothetical protein ACIBQ2_07100 [Micromonospora sediminimaris]|uniref:hypothetical protein n=1 Tax=Micromonospora sediminimaris TaxID=547162 RepID=UPI0037ABC452